MDNLREGVGGWFEAEGVGGGEFSRLVKVLQNTRHIAVFYLTSPHISLPPPSPPPHPASHFGSLSPLHLFLLLFSLSLIIFLSSFFLLFFLSLSIRLSFCISICLHIHLSISSLSYSPSASFSSPGPPSFLLPSQSYSLSFPPTLSTNLSTPFHFSHSSPSTNLSEIPFPLFSPPTCSYAHACLQLSL